MKKTIIALLCIIALITIALTACNGNELPATNTDDTTVTQPADNPTGDQSGNQPGDQSGNEGNTATLTAYKNTALASLDSMMNPVVEETEDESIKAALLRFYNTEKEYIEGLIDVETARVATAKIVEDAKAFAKDTLKPLVIQKLNATIEPLIEKIPQEDLKAAVTTFYETEMGKIAGAETIDDYKSVYAEIVDDTKAFIRTETEKIVIALKNAALEELDPYVTALIAKIPYDSLKTDTQTFYNTEKAKLAAVDTIEGIAPCVSEIKDDMEEYALSKTKEIAIAALEETINAGLAKIPNKDLKDDLTDFAAEEIAKLNAVTKIEDVPTTLSTVLTETQAHIKELLVSTAKDYMARLTAIENTTAYDYLPEAMNPSYRANSVTAASIDYDFTNVTNVTDINKAGFGEQWQMVVENINQSVTMAKVFNVAQTILSAAGNAVDIYITNSYAEEMEYNFEDAKYTGSFTFKNSVMAFNISFVELVNIPGIGAVQPVIKMEYDLTKEEKTMFISLGDAYKVKYTVSDNFYEMVTRYGITIAEKNASRSSYLSIEKDAREKVVGHIYEYTTYESSDLIKACADFYVENGYVSVVGNKSAGMTGFDGYINELYLANSGRLLGYEVRETKTIAKVTATYDTLWFNLWDIQGINSIKVTEKTEANESGRSTVDVYCNGSASLLTPTYNKVLGVKTSRKYDVELRNRYYYTYDQGNDTYVANKVEIPMLFIQEDALQSFTADILKDNSITASIALNQTYLNKILSDYDTLIDIFIKNKDVMSSETIASYLA